MSRSLLMRLLGLLAALALVAGACGNDDDNGDDPGDNGDPTDNGDAAPGDGLLAELQASGSITIGVANEAPYGFVNEQGEPDGFAPEIATLVLAELGITEVNVDVVEFGSLITGLQAGQFDLITAGMYITPARADQILFSDPDYCIAESLGVPAGNPEGIVDYTSFLDNSDLTIAVATGTVEVDYVDDAGIPDAQVVEYGDIEAMYDALAAGEVDAVTGTSATVQSQANARDAVDAVEPFFPLDSDGNEVLPCGGYGFSLDAQDFRDAFNDVLNEFREDGTTMEIITAYDDFSEEDVERANALTVDDFLG